MTKEVIISTIKRLNRNKGAFYGFETLTFPKMNKKSRSTGLPFDGGVVSIHKTFSAKVGISYENAVNNQLERNGEERDFVALKPFGKHHIEGEGCEYILVADKNPEQFYLALDRIGDGKSVIYVGDRIATEAEIADLKANFFPKPSPSKISGAWRTYAVESVIAIS